MAMGTSHNDTLLAEINVTPMVDVMLVLLVIFMVTAPMIEQGVDVDLPKAQAEALPTATEKVILTVDDQRRVFIGKIFVPFSQLGEKLQHNEKAQSEGEIYIRADRHLPYGLVVKIMALAKTAGIGKVGLVTESAEGDEVGAEEDHHDRGQ